MTRRRVLLLAYYFPPMGGSGVQRTLKLAKYLPEAGWDPVVLTAAPGGYLAFDSSLEREVEDAGIPVVRAASLDPTRLFARRKAVGLSESRRSRLAELSQWIFLPDNKIGWLPAAVWRGRQLVRAREIDLILSSAPPYTSHLAAALVGKLTGRPFVADFRDDWLGNPRHVYPSPLHRSMHAAMERFVVGSAECVTVVNDRIRSDIAARHSGALVETVHQGFDPADLRGPAPPAFADGRLHISYLGSFYGAQDPMRFVDGLRCWRTRYGKDLPPVHLHFAGVLAGDLQQKLAAALDSVDGVRVTFHGYLPHDGAVALGRRSDLLWMLVGRQEGEHQIATSKVYEYIGLGQPILALVPDGAARDVLAEYGPVRCCLPDRPEEIAGALHDLSMGLRRGTLPSPSPEHRARFDRRRIAKEMARIFDQHL